MSAGGSRLECSKKGQDGTIRLPFGSAIMTRDTAERCLQA